VLQYGPTMRTIALFTLVLLAGCEGKKVVSDSEVVRSSVVDSNKPVSEAPVQRPVLEAVKVQRVQKARCFPVIPNVQPGDMPEDLAIDCETQDPINPQAFHAYMVRLNNAVQEVTARVQAAQESGDSRMLGIQQRQDGCQHRYPGVFSASNPLAGMCADSPEQISRYQRDLSSAQDTRDQRELETIRQNGVTMCRKQCVNSNNYNGCMASCY
jgi:hypothetical protein